MRNSVDVLVIGAGIVGAAAARALALAGRKVLVLRRGAGIGEASPAAAGMLAAQIEAHDTEALPLALAARERHATLARELRERGHNVRHTVDGIVQVALDETGATALEVICASQQAFGLRAEYISRQDLPGRVPGLSARAAGAMVALDDGCVDNVVLRTALLDDAVRAGAMLEFAAADTILTEKGGRVRGVTSSAGERRAGAVLLASGAWAPLLKGLPRPLPIEPVRGEMVRTAWPAGVERRVLFGPEGYVVPRGDDALLGSTMDRVGFDSGTSPAGQSSILRAAAGLVPSLEGAPVLAAWSGLRPMTPDGRPVLGLDPELAGLAYATGHGRNGVLLGPLTAEIVAQLLVSGESAWDLSPYGVERFSRAPRTAHP